MCCVLFVGICRGAVFEFTKYIYAIHSVNVWAVACIFILKCVDFHMGRADICTYVMYVSQGVLTSNVHVIAVAAEKNCCSGSSTLAGHLALCKGIVMHKSLH